MIVKIIEDESLECVESELEECLAEKFLELGRIRPVYRFQICNLYLSVIQLKSFLQFGKGKDFQVFIFLKVVVKGA